MDFQKHLNEMWYKNKHIALRLALRPFSCLYRIGFIVKKILNQKTYRSRLPIIVVGNITVGGTGKTPTILALIKLLQQQGLRPGVISRGYPISPAKPILLDLSSSADKVGDEPLLIYRNTQVPVCVCRDRVLAIKTLEAREDLDIILSDDGLQNFSFKHHVEVLLFDHERQFGNQQLLPAGPLREPLSRLKSVDFVIDVIKVPGMAPDTAVGLLLKPGKILSVKKNLPLEDLRNFQGKRVVALTAIANPESFFNNLTALGLSFEKHTFQDHYAFTLDDFKPFADAEIIMTEKDAVKCAEFANEHFWYLTLEGKFSKDIKSALLAKLLKDNGDNRQ
ncbi:MAG: lpxK [Gammaproteobacteria bacterium]|jgi:tetraacyldisaccharide 4'-kinase|nr:lpxK [Gammaproteobacteria bacterium]